MPCLTAWQSMRLPFRACLRHIPPCAHSLDFLRSAVSGTAPLTVLRLNRNPYSFPFPDEWRSLWGNSLFRQKWQASSISFRKWIYGWRGRTLCWHLRFKDCKSLRAIYVYAEKVPILPYNSCAFEGCDSKKCKVYVPIGTYDAYSRSEFGYFENIVEFDASSFRNTIATAENQDTTHYVVNDKKEHAH